MSANINQMPRKKRIALVASNPSTSTQTGWPIGFWWSELTHPYWEFTEAGYEVEIFSPEGSALQADGFKPCNRRRQSTRLNREGEVNKIYPQLGDRSIVHDRWKRMLYGMPDDTQ